VRNDIDYLTDNRVYCLRCFRVGLFHNRVGYTEPTRKATLNYILQVTNGMLVNSNVNVREDSMSSTTARTTNHQARTTKFCYTTRIGKAGEQAGID
jgi:hypothetical protein